MRRVELVVRVDKEKCFRFGGVPVWDKLRKGDYPDVSMGTKVPWDRCAICTDMERYLDALQTFDPKKHRHPGLAVLEQHKKKNIRGISVTRADYCDHMRTMMNRILPDGRKVFVYNDFPRFFDISFVFIGADRTAKVMLFIFQGGQVLSVRPSAEVAENEGVKEKEEVTEKAASVEDEVLKRAFQWKGAEENKRGTILKDVVPSQFAGKAVPVLTRREPDIPYQMQDQLSRIPMDKVLSTLTGMGILLRPREFQRITLIQLGNKGMADDLEEKNLLFPETDECEEMPMSPDLFMAGLARLLLPLMGVRSALGPMIEKRVVVLSGDGPSVSPPASSHSTELLRKIGSAYKGYRQGVMDLVANTQNLLGRAAASSDVELHKIAMAPPEQIFTPLSVAYLSRAFRDEVPVGDLQQGVVQVSAIRQTPAWRGDSPQ